MMTFESFASAQSALLIAGFVIAFIMGAAAQKTHFCTMGAVSDWVNMSHTGRLRAWGLAIAVATLGVVVLEALGWVKVDGSFPPYRGGSLAWSENLLGGLLFGIGMTLAGGCGNKCLVRIGGGNLKSIFVLLIMGVIAYFMVTPFPGSDKTLYSILFYPWTSHLAVNVGTAQDLGTLLAGAGHATVARLVIGSLFSLGLIWWAYKSVDFRSSPDFARGGILIGLCVLAAWYVTSNISVSAGADHYSLSQYYGEWDMLAESDAGKPAQGATLSPQSFTFVNPMGQAVGYASSGFNPALLTFGIMAVFGVMAGSFAWALPNRVFRIEWFASVEDFFNHVIGATLMGFGGILAMGCTIGQGITGVSTLALGSFIALAGIIFGSAMTMKVQLYKMIYEDHASFGSAFLTGLVDLKLMPESLRKLERID